MKGGLVCSECMKDVRDGMSLDPSTLYSMQYIETSTIEKLYTFNVTEKVLTELGNVMSRMTDIYVGKHFKSLEILRLLFDVVYFRTGIVLRFQKSETKT